jgi:16S rRNA A1518/A1519 N6-dimethyltransferase RsmA/KsgA/DIM1 with predicted DNA glycosylase/AP lyase activity
MVVDAVKEKVEERRKDVEQFTKDLFEKYRKTAEEKIKNLRSDLDTSIERVFDTLHIPMRKDLEDLQKKLDKISGKLGDVVKKIDAIGKKIDKLEKASKS